jgi:hypothetical protein
MSHPLKGRKLTKKQLAQRAATRAANKAAPPEPKRKAKEGARTVEQVLADMKEAHYYVDKAVGYVRREIRAGQRKLNEVTDFEVCMYMAKRYLEGGMR